MPPERQIHRSLKVGRELAEEERLVRDLRTALPVEAQTIFFRQFEELLAVLAEPRCADGQADGVPCPQVDVSCEECGRALTWVRDLRNAIARSAT